MTPDKITVEKIKLDGIWVNYDRLMVFIGELDQARGEFFIAYASKWFPRTAK